ncbi:MAG: hypothetical protein GEU73_15130 [Chloroflexi bacterium]|nr:hypothetical protein [Chloroflexota bacterium]
MPNPDRLRRNPLIRPLVSILLSSTVLLAAACQPEQRPGTVGRIGGPTGSVSGATGSVSGPGGLPVPTPSAAGPTPGDGVFTPVSDVSAHAAISLDVFEISQLTNAVNDGRPLPSQEILAIYENGKNSRSGTGFRTLRGFARNESRATDFPDAARFSGSPTFLDDPVTDAIEGTGSAAGYSPAQRRQAIQKGLQRILSHWVLQELGAAEMRIREGNLDPATGAPHNVDEAWAFYAGVPRDATYPHALAATAISRESNFQRQGSVDRPIREGLARAQQAAASGNLAEFQAAETEIESRLNTLFYLASARYLNEAMKAAQAGNADNAGTAQVEGLSFYLTIQPMVATADAGADDAITAYYRADPASLTVAGRDEALERLNRAADALGLSSSDRVSPSDFN